MPLKPEEIESPWRKAKPRKPIQTYDECLSAKSPEHGKTNQSPPNSDYKESTRFETTLDQAPNHKLNMSAGASPALIRSGEEKQMPSRKKEKRSRSYTQLKDKSRRSEKINKNSESDSISEGDDQPPGTCQYVGESSIHSNKSSSTIHNASVDRSQKSFRNNSTFQKSKIRNVSLEETKKQPNYLSFLSGAVTGAVIIALIACLNADIFPLREGSSECDSDNTWTEMKGKFRADLKALRSMFPNQSEETWKMISATVKSSMRSNSEYPGVLVLLSTPQSLETANCLAHKLVYSSSKLFKALEENPSNSMDVDQVFLASKYMSEDPYLVKEQLTSFLHSSLSSRASVAILSLDELHPVPALTLHAFADNTNAPYKNAVILCTVSEETKLNNKIESLDKRAERALLSSWKNLLGEDKVYALISRLVVSVAEVKDEGSQVNCMFLVLLFYKEILKVNAAEFFQQIDYVICDNLVYTFRWTTFGPKF